MKVEKKAVEEPVAIADLSEFLKKFKKREFRKGEYTQDKIQEDFPDVIEAIKDGLLTFGDNQIPKFKLRYPIQTSSGSTELGVSQVDFRHRAKPSDKARIMDGLNIQTQSAKYVLRYLAYMTGLSQAEIDLLDPEDYDVINQICSVF